MPGKFTCYLVGEGSLLLKCGEMLLNRGHKIYGIISSNPSIKAWAADHHIEIMELNGDLGNRLKSRPYDYLFSIINLSILPDDVISSPRKSAINFHDGPLPKYAGVNVTSWAIMHQENKHGITWHKITSEADKGDILKQVVFEIARNETTLSLNAKCFEKGLSSFRDLVDELANGNNGSIEQNLDGRTYFGKNKRPAQTAIINWNSSAEEISALVRALDFGRYANPLGLPKVKIGDEYFVVPEITVTDIPSTDAPGVITGIDEESIRIATKTREIEVGKGLSIDGTPLSVQELLGRYSLRKGLGFDQLNEGAAEEISRLDSYISKKEKYWVNSLILAEFPDLHYGWKNRPSKEAAKFKEERIDLDEKILNYLSKLGVKPQITLGSAFGIFIGRHCGRNDFTLGYSDDGLLERIGRYGSLFSEYVPLRVTFDYKAGFPKALSALKGTFEKTGDNQTYSRDVWGRYYELKQCLEKGGHSVSPVNIFFSKNGGEYRARSGSIVTLVSAGDLKYSSFVFDLSAIAEKDIKLLKKRFIGFLGEMSTKSDEEVGRICILSAGERNKLLEEWNDTKVDFPRTKSIHQLFEEQAAKSPEATAVVCQGKSLTYQELNERSNQLAYRLKELGVGPEALVGVCLHRSLEMIVAVMGTLKAGGAYVPLDPLFPKDRISYMIEDSKCSVIITEQGLRDELGSGNAKVLTIDAEWNDVFKGESGNLNSGVRSDNLAYVIYTSGSTGKPRGVMIEHRNVVNFFTGMDACIGPAPGSTWLAVTSLSFDISVLEIFWTLARGFRVVIYPGVESNPRQTARGPDPVQGEIYSIPELMGLYDVTHFQCTPSMASMLMLDEGVKRAFRRLKKLLIGGEAFPAALASELQKVVTGDIINMYGPTETTVWSTTYKLNNEQENIPIGRPVANTTIYILDKNLEPVPVRVPGELMIGGAGVVRGYFNRPELTAERFFRNPFSDNPESRLYRTGDLARYLPDGNIEFLGRMDHQVKILGYRIELGEIEAVLNQHPAIYESVVIAREDAPGQKRLAAYVIPRKGEGFGPSELRRYAEEKLPEYMVPAYIVELKEFPKTPNEKIDRKALPPPEKDRRERGAIFEPAKTDMEEAVAEIWADALAVDRVGRDENFFDLGGNSLSACMIILSIQQTCNVDLPLLIMFQAPTVTALAKKLEEAFRRQADSERTGTPSQKAWWQRKLMQIPAEAFAAREEDRSISDAPFEPPRTPTEKTLAAIWARTLRVNHASRNDHFFRMGGKSLDAVKLFAEIEKEFGKRLPLSTLLQVPTFGQLAKVLEGDAWEPNWSPLVPIQPDGSRIPFFCVHAHRGNVLNYFPLARHLGPEQPFYGLQARGLNGKEVRFRTFTDMAADYLSEIQTVQPMGPYLIGGWCMGGYIALEMARLLKEAGEEVALLALIDTPHPSYPEFLPHTTVFHRLFYRLIERIEYEVSAVRTINGGKRFSHLCAKAKAIVPPVKAFSEKLIEMSASKLHLKFPHSWAYNLQALYDRHDEACKTYDPHPYQGRVALFRASKQAYGIHSDPTLGWGGLFQGRFEVHEIPGHYLSIFVEPSVRLLAERLEVCLNDSQIRTKVPNA